ncbi:flagellar biosynthesis protein FlhF [Metabacillus fastidiosus]|uniref:flagellar biosynthesis protein FlhF n=1 Tax=Metabacillus fastidiosus TaxID=1458 RepID=UPI002E1CD475|nr:flagellar biosynthesis protein FlhF [Metabacillus fastidiosus]MED4532498.1 flagellar biosynthesis protein FlhF [Metabacillus fastidiosus]
MRMKKYIAPTMQDAMKRIRSELGNEAVILNSKVIHTGGFLGLFMKKKIEVIAALDPDVPAPSSKKKEPSKVQVEKKQKEQPVKPKEIDQNVAKELQELKGMVQSISSAEQSKFYPEGLQKINELFIQKDISQSLRGEILSSLLVNYYEAVHNRSEEVLLQKAKDLLLEKISPLEFGGITYEKKYINVVGPTGVGKTTTLAKLAAECMLQKEKTVAFITTDTFRIAAIDQLKTYAKILDAPIEVCYTVEDFRAAKANLAAYDYIFIDTAGRNFLNSEYVNDLKEIVDFNHEIETYLILAATAKLPDMLKIFEQFSIININKLIITKLDETSSLGSLLSLMLDTKKGIAYTTHGQNVPDDIKAASKDQLLDEILEL